MNGANNILVEQTVFDLKSLDKKDARLALRINNFVRTELEVDFKGKSLILAVSGGADSVAMFLLFRALRDYLKLELRVAHLDHALRPSSADEALAVQELCNVFQTPLSCQRTAVAELAAQKRIGLEEAGRAARYEFFEKVRQEYGADWILTAHHLGDLAEDMLLRLIRGAGWPGLGGMHAVRGNIIRPLLLTEKQDLVDLLQRQGVSWQQDESNLSLAYKRNRVRLEMLPLFLRENPGFMRNIRKMWSMARQDEAYWLEVWSRHASCLAGEITFTRADLLAMHKAARLKLYAVSIRKLAGGQALAKNLQDLDETLRPGLSKTIQLPGFIEANMDAACLSFRKSGLLREK